MDEDKDKPIEREPWQRMLQDRAGVPSETTDARIRAAARRALTPRATRWWLPVSLAASFLLAVLIVQWQYGDSDKHAIVTESDLAAPSTVAGASQDAAPVPDSSSTESAPSAKQAWGAKTSQAPQAEHKPSQDEFVEEPEGGGLGNVTVTGSRIGGPERDLQAASELPAEEASDVAPSSEMQDSVQETPTTAITGQLASERKRESSAETRADAPPAATYQQAAAKLRKPEEWYAEIKKLRAAGRVEEADRELERLKAAHPGWLERHLQEKR